MAHAATACEVSSVDSASLRASRRSSFDSSDRPGRERLQSAGKAQLAAHRIRRHECLHVAGQVTRVEAIGGARGTLGDVSYQPIEPAPLGDDAGT